MMKTTKQDKVLKKINRKCGQTIDVAKAAQKAKNDEFYTPLDDITKELFNWSDKFIDKRIVCPCDWDILLDEPDVIGIHIEMDRENLTERDKKFHRTKIKKCYLIRYKRATFETFASHEQVEILNSDAGSNLSKYYEEIPVKDFMYKLFKDDVEDSRLDDLVCQEVDTDTAKRVTCNFIKYFLTTECKSITATGYNVDRDEGIKFQEVNYSNYDICVTNPPFSIYGEFMDCMTKEKDNNLEFNYIVLAPFMNRANPSVGLPLMLKKCYLGYNRKTRINFQNPDKNSGYKCKAVACDWLTTFPEAQDEADSQYLHNNVVYNDTNDTTGYASDFHEMENMIMKNQSHPIRINNFRAIPDDYSGWMFCSVGVLDVLSNKEFEWYGTHFHGYYNKTNPSVNPFGAKSGDYMLVHDNGKSDFAGIVCRRRTPENGNMIDVFTGKDYSK